MAKISAHGARELARHTSQSGTEYLLRSDGVVLAKLPVEGEGWKRAYRLKGTGAITAQASGMAQALITVFRGEMAEMDARTRAANA